MVTRESGVERRRNRRAQAKSTILDAAEELFLAHGFRETKMEDIAIRANLATGSLYRHFETKEDLRQALVRQALDVDTDYLSPAYDETKPVTEQLKNLGARYVTFGVEHPLYFRLLATPDVFGPRDPEKAEAIAAGIRKLVDSVAVLIKAGIHAGELTPTLNKDEGVDQYAMNAADFLHGAWNGLIELSQRDDSLRVDKDRLEQIQDVAVRILQYGLTPIRPGRRPRRAHVASPPS